MKRIEDVLKDAGKGNPADGNSPPPERDDQDVCPICGGMGVVRRDLPIDHPEFGQAVPCECSLRKMEERRLELLRRWSDIGALTHLTFESFVSDPEGLTQEQRRSLRNAFERARSFAENPEGWLVMRGGFGCGKTHLAAAIANHRVAKGEPALFVVVPDLLDYLRSSFSPNSAVSFDQRFETFLEASLLILDDLGTQSTTPWAKEKLFQILNHRYNRRLPTVITTNCELEEIEPRLRSRLLDMDLVEHLVIRAPDFRGAVPEGFSDLNTVALYSEMTFDAFDLRQKELKSEERENLRDAFVAASQYAETPQGWLVLQGVYGCGKTHLAASIANRRMSRGEPVLFVVVPDLLDHLRATFAPNSPVSYDRRLEEVKQAPFLVLDDLGTESATSWAREKLYQICNHRYLARLPTVFTTSYTLDELDPRLRIRMLDKSRCDVVEIKAPAYRDRREGAPPPPKTTRRRRSRD